MRAGDRTEDPNQNDQDRTCRNRIPKQGDGHISVRQCLPHDTRADDGREQSGGADEFRADAAAGNRASADLITGLTYGSDTDRLDGIDDVYVETEFSNGQINVIIRSTNDNTATDKILAVILDFDATGTFDQNDLDAATSFNAL